MARKMNNTAKVHPNTRKAWENKFAGRLEEIDRLWTALYRDVVKAYDDGISLKEIGRMIGVEQSTTSLWNRIGRGENPRPGRFRAGHRNGAAAKEG